LGNTQFPLLPAVALRLLPLGALAPAQAFDLAIVAHALQDLPNQINAESSF
jgi:hypothetical protein